MSLQCEVTLYEILEVSPHASELVIRAAYRSLAQSNHPDKNAGAIAAGERLALINHAYSVLSDPLQRQRYDQRTAAHQHLKDRRGSGATTPVGVRPVSAAPPVSRAFVFRPLP